MAEKKRKDLGNREKDLRLVICFTKWDKWNCNKWNIKFLGKRSLSFIFKFREKKNQKKIL